MADTPMFESPVVKSYDHGDSALTLADVSAMTKTIVRADAGTAVAATLGVEFGSSRQAADQVLVCGQRPGEWMLLGSPEANGQLVASLDQVGHVSVIDHTHSRAMFRLTGGDAISVLEKVCSLDWSDAMTPNGAVVSASVAKVACDVARSDTDGLPSYFLACDRSFGQWLFDAIFDAGSEFGISVAADQGAVP